MTEQYAFATREERDAFDAFVEADRANFEIEILDVETRLALAWGAAREFFNQPTEDRAEAKLEIGLSEFGRGFESGLGEHGERQLRLAALEYTTRNFGIADSSAIMTRAKEYLKFLKGDES